MIKVQGACCRHAVTRSEYDFGGEASNRSRDRHNDDLVEDVGGVVSRQEQDWSTLVWESERVPADLAPNQLKFSHPSASQASGSASDENSSGLVGIMRYAAASSSAEAPISVMSRARSGGVKCSTSGKISSAFKGFDIVGRLAGRTQKREPV